MLKYLLPFLLLCFQNSNAQLTLESDGPEGEDTYDLITSKLAPGYNPIEVPDCGHESFGDHIDEIFDNDLNKNVFRFFIHTDEDDDRCINFDRQRNEIKTYDQSPDSLLGVIGETVEYKWKFKLDADFQSSPKFTHIHQLKSVGGPESSHPLITLTTRKGTPDELELRHGETTSSEKLLELDLAPFKGVWCEVTETVTYGEVGIGSFAITIKRVSDEEVLLDYSNEEIRMWRTDAEFVRPKWGIYRSLVYDEDLRDEEVLFADFSIEEIEEPLPVELVAFSAKERMDYIQLNWQTASEENNKGFTVEKSLDGNSWKPLSFIEGSDTTAEFNHYEYLDRDKEEGQNYYRLKQLDRDGAFYYSKIVSVETKITNSLHVFPNPAKEFITISEAVENGLLTVFNFKGEKTMELHFTNNKIDVSSLAAGVYFTQLQVGNTVIVEKLLILD